MVWFDPTDLLETMVLSRSVRSDSDTRPEESGYFVVLTIPFCRLVGREAGGEQVRAMAVDG